MKKAILLTAFAFIMLAATHQGNAQWWSLTGNAGTLNSNFVGTTDNMALKFKTKNLNRMIITAGGNVGIGTVAPGYKLQVIGTGRFEDGVKMGGFGIVELDAPGIVAGRLKIDSAGNVGIGVPHPVTKLEVAGDAKINGVLVGLGSGGITSNTAVGATAINSNTTGYENTATGSGALFSNTIGVCNTATGFQALYANVGLYDGEFGLIFGKNNTAIGYQAHFNGTDGRENVAIGYKANYMGYGVENTNVGAYAEPINLFISSSTSLGHNAKVNSGNKVRLGSTTVTVIEGQVAYSFPSDARFKNNIKDNIPGLDFIKQLKPITYKFDTKKFEEHLMQNMPDSLKEERMKGRNFAESSNIVHSGFLAQDIEKTCKQLGYDFDGLHIPDAENKTDNYSVAYSQFIMPLVKAVQELSKQNDDQKNQIEELKVVVASCCEVNSSLQAKNSNNAPQASTTLYQNQPNPFNQSTVIRYTLSAEHYSGAIVIRDLSGNTVKSIAINNFGKGQVTVNANELAQGTYTYTLEIADESIDTKLMVITK